MLLSRSFAVRAGLVAIAITLVGCQTFDRTELVASHAPTELPPAAASAIAGDMVSRFTEHVGPGSTTIHLAPDSSAFGQALETSLKGWGYAVVTDQTADGKATVSLAYVVENYEGSVLARLSTKTFDLGRVYQLTPTGASPSSPISLLQRGGAT
ncbi:conjugal transfer protein TrbH [Mesorhizobium tianshanense]|uniref:Conjugative transfer protein TrbH n=1 Tax=Mesorhizobium tianshanense TaxID=39844 RepID=A0A562NBJ0_9HYPH|nr:conjugal transfer protein TrbH [Mesorhizobium tianshanense]TWI29535.1 conjugative transfer protein TrbH [Mesorhizobium tianshanense]GLS34923.1 conjugal transfer protein TrbH [Mesorhizobium tianshanense]